MPFCLSTRSSNNWKILKLTILLLCSPLYFFAQSLTGLWTGVLTNDSNSVRKDQSFEIALTEYRGKVYGYSRSEFIVDNVLYYIVKRVKGTIDGDKCEIKDDEIISYNFPTKLDKGVKVTSTFYRNQNDSNWYLAGSWQTNKTKNYYSLTGKVDLKEEKDLSASKIFPHLEELKLANDVAFYKERKIENMPPPIRTIESDSKRTANLIKAAQPPPAKDFVKAPQKSEPITVQVKTEPKLVKNQSKQETAKVEKKAVVTQPPPPVKEIAVVPKTDVRSNAINTIPAMNPTVAKTTPLKKDSIVENKVAKIDPIVTPPVPEIKKIIPDVLEGRKSEFSQVVNFTSDSLELALYDNGEVDGDTVSVFRDGDVILSHQGLKASAIRKTIYITPGKDDEFTLVLFADNLGKYPPNTGLLVVHDGEDVYNIRFSADLQKNAGVIFKRKKKP